MKRYKLYLKSKEGFLSKYLGEFRTVKSAERYLKEKKIHTKNYQIIEKFIY